MKWVFKSIFQKINACFAEIFPSPNFYRKTSLVKLQAREREVIRMFWQHWKLQLEILLLHSSMLHWKSPWKFPHISKAAAAEWRTENVTASFSKLHLNKNALFEAWR